MNEDAIRREAKAQKARADLTYEAMSANCGGVLTPRQLELRLSGVTKLSISDLSTLALALNISVEQLVSPSLNAA